MTLFDLHFDTSNITSPSMTFCSFKCSMHCFSLLTCKKRQCFLYQETLETCGDNMLPTNVNVVPRSSSSSSTSATDSSDSDSSGTYRGSSTGTGNLLLRVRLLRICTSATHYDNSSHHNNHHTSAMSATESPHQQYLNLGSRLTSAIQPIISYSDNSSPKNLHCPRFRLEKHKLVHPRRGGWTTAFHKTRV